MTAADLGLEGPAAAYDFWRDYASHGPYAAVVRRWYPDWHRRRPADDRRLTLEDQPCRG